MITTRLPICGQYAPDRDAIHDRVRAEAGGKCIRCGHVDCVVTGHVLTVHHFDGNKANNEWWNLMRALPSGATSRCRDESIRRFPISSNTFASGPNHTWPGSTHSNTITCS